MTLAKNGSDWFVLVQIGLVLVQIGLVLVQIGFLWFRLVCFDSAWCGFGSDWFVLVQIGLVLVQIGLVWSRLVRFGSDWLGSARFWQNNGSNLWCSKLYNVNTQKTDIT